MEETSARQELPIGTGVRDVRRGRPDVVCALPAFPARPERQLHLPPVIADAGPRFVYPPYVGEASGELPETGDRRSAGEC